MSKLRVFIGCVPGDCDENVLLDILKSFAKVTSIKLARGRNAKNKMYCIGYGYVECFSPMDVEYLLHMKKVLYKGRELSLRPFKQGNTLKIEKKNFTKCRLFVGGVTSWIKFETLRPLFERFGHLQAFYQVDQSKCMKFKYGYAIFSTPDAATMALEALNGFTIKGCSLRVERFGGKEVALKVEQPPLTATAAIKPRSHKTASLDGSGQAVGSVDKSSTMIQTNQEEAGASTTSKGLFSKRMYTSRIISQPAVSISSNSNSLENRPLDPGSTIEPKLSSFADTFTTGRGSFWLVSPNWLDHSHSNIRMNASGNFVRQVMTA